MANGRSESESAKASATVDGGFASTSTAIYNLRIFCKFQDPQLPLLVPEEALMIEAFATPL